MTALDAWDPGQYNRYADEREQPFGCGDGRLTVAWVKGTSLTRFKEPLGPEGWERFVDRYRARLLSVLGDRSPYLYPFKRILLWGRRG
jgi:trans-aconitate methyltransferase